MALKEEREVMERGRSRALLSSVDAGRKDALLKKIMIFNAYIHIIEGLRSKVG